MDTHKSPRETLDFVRELEQLSTEALITQGSSYKQGAPLHSDERLLGNLMAFLLSEQSAEEQALLERFYHQLLRCYRTGDEHLLKFVHQFIFCLIWRHFHDIIKSRQYGITIRPGLDALLVVIYNLMIVDKEGQLKPQPVTIPSLSTHSIYHDPAEFTENILRGNVGGRGRNNGDEERRILVGNDPPVDTLTRMKKWIVFRVILRNIKDDLAHYSKACQKSAIIMGRLLIPSSGDSGIARGGVELSARREPKPFEKLNLKSFSLGRDKNRSSHVGTPKTVMDERFLLDALDIYYILSYQGLHEECLGLVMDILDEGEHRILASVVLLAGSVKHRLETVRNDPDELEDVPPLNNAVAVPDEKEERSRKVSANSFTGSVKEKRRKSFITKSGKESASASPRGDSFHEGIEPELIVSHSTRSNTPNDPVSEVGDGMLRNPEAPREMLPKVSPRTYQVPMSRSSETVI